MSNLPFTLPDCGQQATVRIEAMSITAGPLANSLDAVVYVCTPHAGDAVTAIETADLEAHVVPMPREVERICGHVHTYPTGNLASEPEHPRWCDRKNCERRGEHRSPARHVDTNRPEAYVVDVALVQAMHPAAEPMVSVTSIDDVRAPEPVATHMLISIGQARVLRYRLANLIDATNGGLR